jgi:hypothetical protein
MWKQTRVLLARSHKRVYRNYVLMVGLVGQGIILGVMVGVAYYQLPEVSPSYQRNGLMLMLDSCCHSKSEEFDVPIDSPGFLPPTSLLYVASPIHWLHANDSGIWKHTTDLVIFDREREVSLALSPSEIVLI